MNLHFSTVSRGILIFTVKAIAKLEQSNKFEKDI